MGLDLSFIPRSYFEFGCDFAEIFTNSIHVPVNGKHNMKKLCLDNIMSNTIFLTAKGST